MHAGWLAGRVCVLGLQSDDGDDDRVLSLSPQQICAEDGIFRGICADYELARHLIKYFNGVLNILEARESHLRPRSLHFILAPGSLKNILIDS